ncbi:uncharacterized protein [Ptychodera flava]|uniref:uncharacterized protein n=1 Tax=Ptychodera flava TaxID=63121 RepID=UPI00396A10E7
MDVFSGSLRLVVLILCFVTAQLSGFVTVSEPYVRVLKRGFYLRHHVFLTKAVGTLLSCGHLCMNTPKCGSVNFSRSQGICQLSDTASSDVDAEADYDYMEIGYDYESANEIGSCVNGCLNNATCTVISTCADESDRLPYQYRCDCVDGYRGLRCEKEIAYVNVAKGKPAWQSSTVFGGSADKAVDGATTDHFYNTVYGSGTVWCTHTRPKINSWWMVDLQRSYLIRWINITNRADCCEFRLLSSEVKVGFSSIMDNNFVCGNKITEVNITISSQVLLDCGKIYGRYVSVRRTDGEKMGLQLCEVQVYAEDPEWETVFLGVGRSGINLHRLWLDGLQVGNKPNIDTNGTVNNYVNGIINKWENLYVKYVKLSLFKDSNEVATVVFDGMGSTKTDWFTSERILASSWMDLTNETQAHMDVGSQVGSEGFLLYVSDVTDCLVQSGWLVLLEDTTGGCDWQTAYSNTPAILYSNADTSTDWDKSDKEEADFMMISLFYQY